MALNQALARTLVEPDAVELDKIEVEEGGEAMEAARAEAEARERQGKLFNGLRFFLGREVPRGGAQGAIGVHGEGRGWRGQLGRHCRSWRHIRFH